MVNVGKSVVIKGELHGSENLTIEGQVEGEIKAQVFAKALVVLGAVNDNIAVSEKGDIRDGEAASATVRRVREAAPGVRSQLVQRVLRAECGGRREPRPSSATGCSDSPTTSAAVAPYWAIAWAAPACRGGGHHRDPGQGACRTRHTMTRAEFECLVVEAIMLIPHTLPA